MRVSILCPYSLSTPGGVQVQALGLARALRGVGHDVRVIAPCDGPPPEPGVVTVGSSAGFRSNGSVSPVAAGREVTRRTLEAIRSFGPDVLHLHEPMVPGPTIAALLGTDVPSVGTFHASSAQGINWYRFFGRPVRSASRRLSVRTAVSEEARQSAEEVIGGHFWVLPNGIEVDRYAKADPWPTDGTPAILFVGRHEPRKGLGVLLDAFADLDRDATLWVVGEGPQTEALQARGVPHVEWLGTIGETEKAARLRAATICCAPSLRQESFGIVLLEAMAAGAVVVASDIAGYRNVARSDEDALLFPAGDVDALRARLRTLLDDPDRRAGLVAGGERRAAQFSMDRTAERYLPVYDAARARGRP
jgi:phosphatidylinositol alpha-mannosyltransferase